MKQFPFLIIISMIFFCCNQAGQPEFKRIENLEVKNFNKGSIIMNGDAVFYNPNPTKVNLERIDLLLFINNKEVGKVNQIKNIEIPANSDFSVPIILNADPGKLTGGWLGAIPIVGEGAFDFSLKGTATIKVLKLPVPIPIEYTERVELNL